MSEARDGTEKPCGIQPGDFAGFGSEWAPYYCPYTFDVMPRNVEKLRPLTLGEAFNAAIPESFSKIVVEEIEEVRDERAGSDRLGEAEGRAAEEA